MKIAQATLSLLAVAGAAIAAPSGSSPNHPPDNGGHGGDHGGHGGHGGHGPPPHHPKLPLVESEKLRNALEISKLFEKANVLQDFAYSTAERNRVIGSPGHNKTVNWIYDTISKYPDYYTVKYQPFDLSLAKSANLTVNDTPLEVFGVSLAPAGAASAKIMAIPGLACDAADFPASVAGSIVLVLRGDCQAGQKVALGAAAGAVGAIVYNNVEGNLDGYSLQRITTPEGPYVPTGGISQADGLALIARLEAGEEITANLATTAEVTTTYNVIAQTIEGDQDNVLHISGHSDSVAAGPGINDNGSGTISLLEIAIQLTKFSVNNAVRISWWSAEEAGLLGAAYYVSQCSQAELDVQRLVLDFDMMSSPNFAYQIYDGDGSSYNLSGPAGSAEAEHEFEDYFSKVAGLNFTSIEFDGRSDYGPFLEAGVATGGIACGAEGIKTVEEQAMFGGQAGVAYDINYHGTYDDVHNVNGEAWIEMSKAIAHMTAKYARSWESIPPRTTKRSLNGKREVTDKMVGKTWGI